MKAIDAECKVRVDLGHREIMCRNTNVCHHDMDV